MVQCDKPTGKKASLHFIYPELARSTEADKPARLKRLAEIVTAPQDGRLTRTFVIVFGKRSLVEGWFEPVDDMKKRRGLPSSMDRLAEDFTAHDYDVKFLIGRI